MEKYMVFNNFKYKVKLMVFIGWMQILLTTMAYAHVLPEQSGWAHPLSGLDHILAMVAVGAWSAILGNRAVWLVPTFFVCFMFVGSLIGIEQIELPYTEIGIAISVIVLGIAIAVNGKIPVIFATLCTALFGVFHGYAHGYELPVIDDAVSYISGFMLTTALLHVVGLWAGHYLLKYKIGKKILHISGFICTILGVCLLVKLL